MIIKKELIKSILLALIPLSIAIYGSLIFSDSCEIKIFSILVIVLITIIYLILLHNDLKYLENEYNYDIHERIKGLSKKITDTQSNLAQRGLTYSGDAAKLLGKHSAFTSGTSGAVPFGTELPKGEIQGDYDDYVRYRNQKFELDVVKAKYLVIMNLFKIKN